MYVITNKFTGFKLYLSEEQWIRFHKTTGSKLIRSGKAFTNLYSIKRIPSLKDIINPKLKEISGFCMTVLLMTIFTLAAFYFGFK